MKKDMVFKIKRIKVSPEVEYSQRDIYYFNETLSFDDSTYSSCK